MEQKQQLDKKRQNAHKRVASVLLCLLGLLVAGYLLLSGWLFLWNLGQWIILYREIRRSDE